jgi:cyclohexanecarboxylate-CoA ligase
VDGIELSIRDDTGADVVPGEAGEIWVRGPLVCRGYTDPAATAEAFDEAGFFRTGDLGLLRTDGHAQVGAVAVIGLPDDERGERVCAVLEVAVGHKPPTLEALRAHCHEQGLSSRKVPEQLEVVEALPRTPTMKVLKRVLRESFTTA